MLQQIIYGVLLGGVFALVGIGMSMIFGIVKLTNLAHGEFIILSAYISTVIWSSFGVHPLLTLIVTVPLMFFFGVLLQNLLINKVMDQGSEPALLVTFGLSIIIQNVLLLIFTADAQRMVLKISTPTLDAASASSLIAVSPKPTLWLRR
jgi:branched-chain amino acid transport system permease protein